MASQTNAAMLPQLAGDKTHLTINTITNFGAHYGATKTLLSPHKSISQSTQLQNHNVEKQIMNMNQLVRGNHITKLAE